MTRRIYTGIAAVLALLAFVQQSPAGQRSAALKGKISDSQGFPLVGAYSYVSSPSLLGIYNFITSETGTYVFPDLPPGVFKITVEMPGFKTISAEGIALTAGATVTLNFKMEPSETEDEVVTRKPVQGLDKSSARLASVLDRDILSHIPLPRDFSAVLGLVPGVVIAGDVPSVLASVHGAPATGNIFLEDGVNVTDPVNRTPLTRINIDTIDQVVIETAGLAADRDPGQGAYVNVIRQPGGNDFYGSMALFYTGKGLSKSLWSEDELNADSLTAPRIDKGNLDASLTAGGPLLHDIGWFFSNFRLRLRSQGTPFQSWKDPFNIVHPAYGWRDSDFSGMFKLSAHVTKQFSGMAEMSFSKVKEPVYEPDVAWNRPQESTRRLDGQAFFLARAGVAYMLDQRTAFDVSMGYASERQPLLLNDIGQAKPSYLDTGTGRVWGSGPYNDREGRKRFRGNLTITRFQDRLLGTDHELVAGGDYETGKSTSLVWKADSLVMNYLNGSPYTLGQAVSPGSGSTVGLGLIGFSTLPAAASAPLGTTREVKRLGIFARDTLTIGGRVSLALGLRFDRSDTQVLTVSKAAVGNAVALSIGDSLIKPLFGFNPFGAGAFAQRESVITWNTLSPRFGLSIDLLGTGKTLLRGSYARLLEDLGLGYMKELDPVSGDRIHQFYWYDENGDGKVGTGDTYVAFPENYGIYTALYVRRLAPGLRAPVMDEWTAGLEHELMPDFSLSVRYISRSQKGLIGDVMYDPATDRPWYSIAGSPSGWWVPFNTTVPASAAYPETNVTVYFPSTTAPGAFDRIQTVPELTRKYKGLELSFRKRMSHNWQLFGSIVWSRSTGTTGLASPLSAGITAPILTPNSFVNVPANSRTELDRPLAIRVMGTLRFKYDIYLSAYYRYMSGSPWGRTVTVTPPADWALAHGADVAPVTVFLESPGTRRHGSLQSTDLRLEKEFMRGGRARWTVYFDVLNLFGDKYRIIDYNDGLWFPSGEGASSGTHLLSGTYGRAIFLSGARTVALSVRLGF